MKASRFALALTLCAALAAPAAAASADEAMEPQAGDCLTFDGDPYDSMAPLEVVDCAQEHIADVLKMLDYPSDAGAPSTIADDVWSLFGGECTSSEVMKWLGAGKVRIPLLVQYTFHLPSDDQWAAGERWAMCAVVKNGAQGPATYEGSLPDLFKATPLKDWAACLVGAPKSGDWSRVSPCSAKSKWLLINGISIKGKPGKNYPKDLQAKADSLCAKKAKPLLKSGAKVKPVAGLGPAKDMPPGRIFGDCFISYKEWTGRG